MSKSGAGERTLVLALMEQGLSTIGTVFPLDWHIFSVYIFP